MTNIINNDIIGLEVNIMGRPRKQNMVGETVKYFKVLELSDKKNNKGEYLYKCECVCGEIKYHTTSQLNQNTSCGCMRGKHNLSKTRIYNIYHGMKSRCYNPNNVAYDYYGGKGIEVCEEWLNDFINFYKWAIDNGYNDNLTIERIDSDKGYEPSNCEWILQSENARRSNRVGAKLYTYNGESLILSEWSKKANINLSTLKSRIKSGMTIEEALTKKVRGRK